MTHQVKGVVSSCTTRDQQTRRGMAQIHGCIVDGVEFETGFKKTFNEGEMISTAVNWNYGKWNAIPNNNGDGMPPATMGGPGGQSTAPPKKGGFAPKGSGGNFSRGQFPVDPKDGSISIIRQNAMNRAVEVLDTWMAEPQPLFLPSDQQEYMDKLIEVALVITDFSSGQDITNLQAALAANKVVMGGE